MKTLVIGYGNDLRSDDSAGLRLAQWVQDQHWPEVEVRLAHQLDLDLAEEAGAFERIVFLDAATSGPEASLEKIELGTRIQSASHHLTPALLLNLARILGGRPPEGFVCMIRGENFNFGQELSSAASARTCHAQKLIQELLHPVPAA